MFRTHISNNFLNESKVITAKTQWELDQKVKIQRKKWREKEKQIKEQKKIVKMKEKATADTEAALELISWYQNLLKHSLEQEHRLNWQMLYNNEDFLKPEPTLDTFIELVNVPKEDKIIEFLFPSVREKRLKKQREAERLYNEALSEYFNEKNEFSNDQKQINESVDLFKLSYEEAIAPFVERYFGKVLELSNYPPDLKKHFDIQYLPDTNTLIVDYHLPHLDQVPNIAEYKFIQTRKEITTKKMKKKEFENYYEDILYQMTLRTFHEVFSSDYAQTVELLVFNGWVHGVDTATGLDFNSCIISLQAEKKQFLSLNLEKVIPKDCFRSLKGLNASALHQLAPVRPILEINKEDKRFVESKEILANINSIPNLAVMPWEDFEHLVRELFEQYFSDVGAEVKVTKASRDGGIDAVAFDPDPIRGGKFIIQAKRYNHVVPISAVRELNGIMADEGAVKGILVTTSYYGNDSREFIKGKPLTLLDGSNLIQMFNEYGYKVRIELTQNKKLI
ncbi:restriction endonuclease [Pseudobacillus wudalianchiensis]|uniref:restriction endonuclease n=1 Tax=Pseudobacillus wudalianchiensis TaxID=1743143 RepID=UPI000808716E|nr:restriction endonuclease [Bacillus wudalianchiensis]